MQPPLLILSGTVRDRGYYERQALSGIFGAVQAIIVEYPQGESSPYHPLTGRMSQSLRWSNSGAYTRAR
jgi:hypothetical protein